MTKALLYQVGEKQDYEPEAVTLSLGNDDQAFWALAVLSAAERAFPDPPPDQPQWLALAQAVFNRQSARWDTLNCGGGMRWQVPSTNSGYDYKNSISNGLFFHIGARLARYTGNQTYADLAERTYDWCKNMGLITAEYLVPDGAHIPPDLDGDGMSPTCSVSEPAKWSYNAGVMLSGAAFMYNFVCFRTLPQFAFAMTNFAVRPMVLRNGKSKLRDSWKPCNPISSTRVTSCVKLLAIPRLVK